MATSGSLSHILVRPLNAMVVVVDGVGGGLLGMPIAHTRVDLKIGEHRSLSLSQLVEDLVVPK